MTTKLLFPGAVCVGVGYTRSKKFNGMRCVVLKRLAPWCKSEHVFYLVMWEDGGVTSASMQNLLKTRFIRAIDTLTTWGKCPWRPKGVKK